MKRNLLLGICAFAIVAASAQSIRTKSYRPEGLQKVERKSDKTLQFENKPCFIKEFQVKETNGRTILPLRKAPTLKEEVKALYALPDDALHFGMGADMKPFLPSIVLPTCTDIIFRNFSTPSDAECSWILQDLTPEKLGEMLQEDVTDRFKILPEANNSYSTNWPATLLDTGGGGWNLSPIVNVTSGDKSDSYFYSKGATYNGQKVENVAVYFPAGEFTDLTTVETVLSRGFTKIQNEAGEIRGFGSGYTNSKGEKSTGILSMYPKPTAPLVINTVSFHAVPNTPKDKFAVSYEDLALKVYKVEGTTITDQVIAEAVCVSAPYNSKGDSYYITFQFVDDQDEDAVFTLNQDAAIEISGFEKCDITVLTATTQGSNGRAYGVYPSGLDYISYAWATGEEGEGTEKINLLDFMLNLNAAYVTLTSGGEEYSLSVPTTGGVATDADGYMNLAMYSTFPFDTKEGNVWIATAPEWTKVGINNKKWGSDEIGCAFIFQVQCEELTSGTGRSGDVVFETLGGIQTKVHVKQGDGGVGITSTEASAIKTIVNGDNVQLTYPAGVNTVAIVNIAGQTIASYELPANGTYNMSIANLNKGMYLLKFNNNTTAKIIK